MNDPRKRTRAYWFLLALAMILGFALRLAAIVERNHAFQWEFDEYLYYDSTAENAFDGKGFFPTYNTTQDGIYVPPPLQSFFILTVFKLTGMKVNHVWLLTIQALLSMVMIGLGAEIGRHLRSVRCGLIAGFLLAVFPPFVHWTAILTTEANYLLLLALVLWLAIQFVKNPTLALACATALALGLLDLQRGNALFLGPLLALFAFRLAQNRRRFFNAAAFLLVPFLILSPWMLRNLRIYHEPIWVNSNGGFLFHLSNRLNLNPLETPYWNTMIADPNSYVPELEKRFRTRERKLTVTYYQYSKAYFQTAKSYIWHHPIHFAKNYALKFIQQLTLYQDATAAPGDWSYRVGQLTHWLILLGGLLGCFYLNRFEPRDSAKMTTLFFLYFAAFGAFFHISLDGRMNLFLKFFLLIFLATGIDAFLEMKKPR